MNERCFRILFCVLVLLRESCCRKQENQITDEPDYESIEFGGVLKYEEKEVNSSDSDFIKAVQNAALFIEGRFPWSVIKQKNTELDISNISSVKKLYIVYSADDQHPVVKETLDGNPQIVIFGAIYRFVISWTVNENLFVHNVTVSRYPHNIYHIYSHIFHILSKNQTCYKQRNYIHSKMKYSGISETEQNFYISSCPDLLGQQLAADSVSGILKNDRHSHMDQSDFVYDWKNDDGFSQSDNVKDRKEDSCSQNTGNFVLKVMTYNIWNMNSLSKKSKDYVQRIKRLGEIVAKSNPDIVGFQEVRYEHRKGGQLGPNQMKHLADMLPNYQFVFTPGQLQPNSLHEGRTEEGVAIFSKFPVLSYHYILLFRNRSNSADTHQRICQHIVIQHPVFGIINSLNTHMSLSHEAREKSAVQIWKYMQKLKGPVTLMGDLNAEPDEKAVRFLRGEVSIDGEHTHGLTDTWLQHHGDNKEGHTFYSLKKPLSKRIDYIFMREYKYIKLADISVLDDGLRGSKAASDHVPLVARFIINIP